jgi:S-adenosylmethionine decarboxylase
MSDGRRKLWLMQGLHLTADLRGCDTHYAPFSQPDALRRLCLDAVAGSGLVAVGELFHRFPAPGGVTGVVLLAESHLAVHTWPELGAVTLDVYVCNLGRDNGAAAEKTMAALVAAFAPTTVQPHRLQRGELTP